MPEPSMAQPGGNEYSSNPPQVGLGVEPMFTRELREVLVCGGRRRIGEKPSQSGDQRGEVALGEGGSGGAIGG
ncbi:hypothetical protein M0R45_018744 [Rubus argutus]|uniref:Uncharacterized protein n=1 Tax=Rubus argutus TaxID=59490 RepID=A0AAW1X769_RUBAR